MKIQSINSNYAVRNKKNLEANNNKVSFGHIVWGDEYKDNIADFYVNNEVSRKDFFALSKLGKKRINLKKILDYDKQSDEKKAFLDEVFAAMEPKEVDDLTVNINPSIVFNHYHDNLHDNNTFSFDFKSCINAELPKYDEDEDSFTLKWGPATIAESSREDNRQTIGDYNMFMSSQELRARLKPLMDNTNKELKNHGMKFADGYWKRIYETREGYSRTLPIIASDKMLDVISNGIKEHFNHLEKARKSELAKRDWVAEREREATTLNKKRQEALALLC